MKDRLIHEWLERGVISEEQAAIMLEDLTLAYQDSSSNKFITAISIIGALFLGIGVIWIVASNWEGMQDWLKIAVLMLGTGGMLYSGYEIGYHKKSLPKTGHSLVFLSALLFGASIFLIAQIYHVQAHASYLLLFWLIGIFPLVYIFQSPLIAILSCVVFCTWFNFYMLNDLQYYEEKEIRILLFFYMTFGILLFAMGSLHYFLKSFLRVSRVYRLVGILLTIVILFILTFRYIYDGLKEAGQELAAMPFLLVPLYILIVVLLLTNFKLNPTKSHTNLIENVCAFVILTCIFLVNILAHNFELHFFFWILFNVLFIILILVLFKLGYDRMDMKLVNMASLSTFVFIVFKFFDLFADLLDNGFVWLLFGIAILVGSVYFEKKRRQIRDDFRVSKKKNQING